MEAFIESGAGRWSCGITGRLFAGSQPNTQCVFALCMPTLHAYTGGMRVGIFRVFQLLIVDQVRTALLGGVRAAVLWDQVGGRRRHLVVKRRQYVWAAEELLGHLPSTADD